MVRVVIRVPPEMSFSQETIDAINSTGMIFSRRTEFMKPYDYVIINHGSDEPITFGPKVKSAIVLNPPDKVKLSVHKSLMYEQAKAAGIPIIPTFTVENNNTFIEVVDQLGLPFIVKPDVGHKGHGIKVFSKVSEVYTGKINLDLSHKWIVQKYIPKTAEYRFNFIAGQLVNVSRKLLPQEAEKHPGVFDGWLSLGQATNLHKKAHKLAKSIADAFPLPSLAVDLLRVDLGDEKVEYHFCEVNTAYGLGPMTAQRVLESVLNQHKAGQLSTYKVK